MLYRIENNKLISFWNKKQNWPAIIGNAKQTFSGMTETYAQAVECGKLLSYFEKWGIKTSVSDLFNEAVRNFKDANRLTAQKLKEDKDWREIMHMSRRQMPAG